MTEKSGVSGVGGSAETTGVSAVTGTAEVTGGSGVARGSGVSAVTGTAAVTAMVGDRAVIVCVGPGGVGKTSIAAAVGLLGARAGRRVVVLTVDPARRLADALGLADGGDDPVVGARAVAGPWPGELWATMLDARSTFDELIRRHASDPAQAEVILANRLYRNLAGTLSGTQEFMAAERLLELHLSRHFDLVVVDTPPSTNALDFLGAPQRVLRFLDSRAYRVLMAPTRSSARMVGLAAGAVLRSISRVVGADVVADTSEFFAAFEGMEAGFRSRSEQVRDLLSDPDTAYLLVTSLQTDRLDAASSLVAGLGAGGHLDGRGPDGVVANRTHPSFGLRDVGHWENRSRELAGTGLGPAATTLAAMQRQAGEEASLLKSLGTELGAGFTVPVPELDSDVHDMTGITAIADHLAGNLGLVGPTDHLSGDPAVGPTDHLAGDPTVGPTDHLAGDPTSALAGDPTSHKAGDVASHPQGLDTSPDQSG